MYFVGGSVAYNRRDIDDRHSWKSAPALICPEGRLHTQADEQELKQPLAKLMDMDLD